MRAYLAAPGSGIFVMSTTFWMMENETKRVLDTLGTPIIQYPFYLCFARDLWTITRSELIAAQGTVAVSAAKAVTRWHERGLNLDTLNAIRVQVFAIPDAQQT